MRRLLAGTAGFTDPERDFATLDLVELNVGRGPMPSLREAQRWRHAAPDGFAFLLRADVELRSPSRSAPFVRSWKQTMELARALDAALVVVPTPSGFRPTDGNASLVASFFTWAHRGGIRLAWEPRSAAWPDDALTRLCRELSVSHVVDPLRRAPVRGRPPAFRLNGRGGPKHGYSDDELAEARQRIDAYGIGHPMYDDDRAYVVFGNASRYEDACRMRAHAGSDAPSP